MNIMKWNKNKFNIFEFKKWKIVVSNLTFLWSRYLLLFIILFHSIGKTLKSFVQKILYKVTLTLDCIFNNSYFRFKLSFSCVIKNTFWKSDRLRQSYFFHLYFRCRRGFGWICKIISVSPPPPKLLNLSKLIVQV